jgi:hypothetical protein
MKQFSVVVALFLYGCSTTDSIVVVPPGGEEYCEEAEQNLLRLGCFDAMGFPGGMVENSEGEMITFAALCREVNSHGYSLAPQCLSEVRSCDEVNSRCGG